MTVRDLYYLKARQAAVTINLAAFAQNIGVTTPNTAGGGLRLQFSNASPAGNPINAIGSVAVGSFSASTGVTGSTVLNVTYSGGATGPATILASELASTGLVFTALPQGGSATISTSYTTGAAGTAYSATGTITAPAGITDTNPANNTASVAYSAAWPVANAGFIHFGSPGTSAVRTVFAQGATRAASSFAGTPIGVEYTGPNTVTSVTWRLYRMPGFINLGSFGGTTAVFTLFAPSYSGNATGQASIPAVAFTAGTHRLDVDVTYTNPDGSSTTVQGGSADFTLT